MTLRLNVDKLKEQIPHCDVFRTVGRLRSVRDILTADLHASLGEICEIRDHEGATMKAEVIAVHDGTSQLMTFEHACGLAPGMHVTALQRQLSVPVGDELLGRVLNGLGQVLDSGPSLARLRRRSTDASTPRPLERTRITTPVVTGQRAIDGLLTIGQGQRIGLFAGSGVGKSTLLGEIAKYSEADLNVIALVGERGREVVPFLEDCLGEEGLRRSIVVVATSDETPLMKIQAARTAITIAEDFRNRGANVLFFLDSLTRFASAQKEIGLARGEAPGQRGYPPTVFSSLSSLLERLGNNELGSITGLISVLLDGDDQHEPVADAARSILDGHIVLDRQLAAMGHYPAINILESLSRLFRDVTTAAQQSAAHNLRRSLATHAEVAELIQVGLYQSGSSPEVDSALQRLPHIKQFLTQRIGESSSFGQTQAELTNLFSNASTNTL